MTAGSPGAGTAVPSAAHHRGGSTEKPSFLEIDGRQLEVRRLGSAPEKAPTLVFLHHGLGSLTTWRDLPDVLAAATGCGALIYSRAGYGASDPRPAPWPSSFMHHEAQVVLPELLAAAGVREVVLVGHSDGASIALIYAGGAARTGVRLGGLILEAPHLFVEEICIRTIARLRRRNSGGELFRKLAHHHGANAEPTFDAWTEVWLRPEFRRWNIESFLAGVSCPMLVFQGDADRFGTARQVEALTAVGGPVEAVMLPGCGHQPHRERRQEFLRRSARFIRDFVDTDAGITSTHGRRF